MTSECAVPTPRGLRDTPTSTCGACMTRTFFVSAAGVNLDACGLRATVLCRIQAANVQYCNERHARMHCSRDRASARRKPPNSNRVHAQPAATPACVSGVINDFMNVVSSAFTARTAAFDLARTAAFDRPLCASCSFRQSCQRGTCSRTERSSPTSHFSALLLLHDHWSCWVDAAKDAPWAFGEPSS